MFCRKLAKIGLKNTIFFQIWKKPKKAEWPNHFISCKPFQKGQIRLIW